MSSLGSRWLLLRGLPKICVSPGPAPTDQELGLDIGRFSGESTSEEEEEEESGSEGE